MPILTTKHYELLGPLINPFDRSPNKNFNIDDLTAKGEAHNDEFMYAIHNGIDNGEPKTDFSPCVKLTIEERDEIILKGKKLFEKCYLWIIDQESIKIAMEKTPNATRGSSIIQKNFVCHTNITGCRQAFTGGEMYFCEDNNIYINFQSDRYGYRGDDERKQYVTEVLEYMGYKNIKLLKDIY